MRDKHARRRILILENQVSRLEYTIENIAMAMQSSIQQPLYGSTCTRCNCSIHEGMVCPDQDCPHGLDEGLEEGV